MSAHGDLVMSLVFDAGSPVDTLASLSWTF